MHEASEGHTNKVLRHIEVASVVSVCKAPKNTVCVFVVECQQKRDSLRLLPLHEERTTDLTPSPDVHLVLPVKSYILMYLLRSFNFETEERISLRLC